MSRTRARSCSLVTVALALGGCDHASAAMNDAGVDALDAVDAGHDAIAEAVDVTDVVLTARACTITAPAPASWRLHADGTLLRDDLDRVVFLRGVNAGGRSKFAPYAPFDYAAGQYAPALATYMDRAASWGIDVMRVPFTWAALEPTQGNDDLDWLDRYRQFLDAAWSRGIWTVVDFHQDVYSENFCGDGFPAWTIPATPAPHHDCPGWSMEYVNDADVQGAFDRFWPNGSAVQTAYLSAWDVMIAHFADAPGVLGFEPINEPGWGTADPTMFEATALTDFYSRVVPHMRSMAPASLVFVDPTGLAGVVLQTALSRPTGDGIVFAPHYYPIVAQTSYGLVRGLQTWVNVGANWNVPVFVGEFGASNTSPTAEAYMAAHFAAFDTLGLSGTEWEYSVAAEGWNSETNSVVAADGTEYPVAAALVRPFARAVAGASVQQQWTGSEFTLSYQPSGGVTEVQLPARAFPNGYRVGLTGGCYDDATVPGRMLVQPDVGSATVTLVLAPSM